MDKKIQTGTAKGTAHKQISKMTAEDKAALKKHIAILAKAHMKIHVPKEAE